jgi:Glycine zipper
LSSHSLATYSCALVLLAGLAGPASTQTSRPSSIVCDSFARNYAQNSSRQGQVFKGAGVGSLVGLGIGALAGGAGIGMAVGATIGGIGGGARRQSDADRIYAAAYQDCMAGRIR